jgi:protein-S-isoprenylcysteine O-methyltransferase Ste14
MLAGGLLILLFLLLAWYFAMVRYMEKEEKRLADERQAR